jgi:stage V sporulation protein SpoVS
MKKTILFLFLLTVISISAQNTTNYKKVYDYNEYHKDWALVKSIAGTYGFIDRSGKEIVPAIYAKIYKFNDKKMAMVKNVAGAYGFIDNNGKEVVKVIYFKKEEAIQRLNTLL